MLGAYADVIGVFIALVAAYALVRRLFSGLSPTVRQAAAFLVFSLFVFGSFSVTPRTVRFFEWVAKQSDMLPRERSKEPCAQKVRIEDAGVEVDAPSSPAGGCGGVRKYCRNILTFLPDDFECAFAAYVWSRGSCEVPREFLSNMRTARDGHRLYCLYLASKWKR